MCDGEDLRPRLQSPLHREAYDYWCSKADAGRLPGRDAIDPLELPAVLPWLNLIDVLRDGEKYRFRHRLIGTGIVSRFGRDSTGSWFDELYDAEFLESHQKDYVSIVESGRPALSRVPMPLKEKNFITYERLALPLATDGVTIDMIMVVLDFDELRDS